MGFSQKLITAARAMGYDKNLGSVFPAVAVAINGSPHGAGLGGGPDGMEEEVISE